MNTEQLLKLHLFTTIYMTGIIWLVQIIHYPLFKFVGRDQWSTYHQEHIKLTSIVIAGPMIVELISYFLVLYLIPVYRENSFFLISGLLLLLIWGTTFFVSVPLHNTLANGFIEKPWSLLVTTNWIRTISWTARAILILWCFKLTLKS
jgi:hypothetical protein